jgi:flavin-dependent dehydrogenase
VVGARCAGAATARLLAAAGFDVLLVDRTRLPADTVSTHALMLGGVIQLNRWGLLPDVAATGAPAVDAIDVTVGEVSFTAPVKDIGDVGRLYAPRRIVLDALLADAAVAAGAELVDGATVTGITRRPDGRVDGVTGATAGRPWGVKARWVVGADGVRSTVAGLVDAPVDRRSESTNSCYYAYFRGLESTHYTFAFGPGSGTGAIPPDQGLTCVYAGVPVGEHARVRADLDREFVRIVEQAAPALAARVRAGARVTGFRGVRGLPSYLRRPVGPGWLLVGDAGYHRDPYSAHGMTDAFRDAELAAAAILDAAGGTVREPAAMAGYADLRDDFAVPMYEATAQLASYELDMPAVLDVMALMGDEGEREARFLAALPALTPARAA